MPSLLPYYTVPFSLRVRPSCRHSIKVRGLWRVARTPWAKKGPVNSFNVDIATPAYFESPINKLVGDQIKGGTLPLWNPYQGAGTPLLAQYSTRALFPLQILEDISPVWTWDFFMLFRLLVAGFFTFLFLRALSLAFVPAFLGGVFYIFSGTFVWFINLEQMTNVAVMLPVLFFALERLARRSGWGEITFAGVALGLTLLAGQPEIAFYLIAAAYIYYLVRLFISSKLLGESRTTRRAIFDICVASLFGPPPSGAAALALYRAMGKRPPHTPGGGAYGRSGATRMEQDTFDTYPHGYRDSARPLYGRRALSARLVYRWRRYELL